MITYVYVLKSKASEDIYVGSTSDLANNLKEHNQGDYPDTSESKPWELIYVEDYDSPREAKNREGFLKTAVGRNELDSIC